jgi:H+/Cl- antiporter ClcA
LVSSPAAWSLSALALLIAFKGFAWSISLGGFRGGPVFPSLFLGAAAGLLAAKRPGFSITPGPLIIVGVVVAYLTTQLLSKLGSSEIVTPPPREAPARR